MTLQHNKQQEYDAINEVFEAEHPNLEIVHERQDGGLHPDDADIMQIAFCHDTFNFYKRTYLGVNVSALENENGQYIPCTGIWKEFTYEDMASISFPLEKDVGVRFNHTLVTSPINERAKFYHIILPL